MIKGVSLKDHIGRVGRRIKMIFSRMIHHSICTKLNSNSHISQVLALVKETSAKLANWLVLKTGCADLIDPSSVGSTQYEVLGL